MNLADLKIGEKAHVRRIHSSELEVALLNLGLAPGEIVVLANQALGGDPIAFRVNGTKIALRRRDAKKVEVEKAG